MTFSTKPLSSFYTSQSWGKRQWVVARGCRTLTVKMLFHIGQPSTKEHCICRSAPIKYFEFTNFSTKSHLPRFSSLLSILILACFPAHQALAAAPTLEIDAKSNILAADTDGSVTLISTEGIKPAVANNQAFDLTAYPNLRAVQVHAVNGAQPITMWPLGPITTMGVSIDNDTDTLAADTPDGICVPGLPVAGPAAVLEAMFGGAMFTSLRTAAGYDFSLMATPSAFYNLGSPFLIGDGALENYFFDNWDVNPCALKTVITQPANTDQRQTLYVPAGAQTLYFGIEDGTDFSDNTGYAVVSLMMTASDVFGSAPATGGTAVNAIDTDTLNGSRPVLGSATASVAESPVDPQGNAAPWPADITLDTATGNIQVAPNTTPGTYSFWYQLCDNTTSPASCALAKATVTVRDVAPATAAAAVPTLGEMALALLALLLAGGAALGMRRGR